MADLNFDTYVRSPFRVKAVQITPENMEEVAALVGQVRVFKGEKYISLDRRIVPNVTRAYVGWYLTVLGDNLRCYNPELFASQFLKTDGGNIVTFDFVDDDENTVNVVSVQEVPSPPAA